MAEAGEPREVSREEAQQLIDDGAQLIDVRVDHEWEVGRIAGASHLPLDELAQRAGEIDRDRPVVLYCRSGSRSELAAEGLSAGGFDAHALAGGISAWAEQGRPLEPEGGYVAESGLAAAILEARHKNT
jgi:rhodanese-related sulfurtransferase